MKEAEHVSSRKSYSGIFTLIALGALAISSRETFAQWSHREGDTRGKRVSRHLHDVIPAQEWDASNFASEKDLQWLRDAKFGLMFCNSIAAYVKKEMSWGVCHDLKLPDPPSMGKGRDEGWTKWPEMLTMEKYDPKQWIDMAQRAGCKYIVVMSKHHDGFHYWDTDQSEFKITNTPYGRDFLKELADACHEAGMPFGIYYSQRDWYHPDYMPIDPAKITGPGTLGNWKVRPGETGPMGERHQKYIDYQFKAVRELCTGYGKVDLLWWDAAWWGGMFTAEMWDAEKLTRMVRELQPQIVMNNRCSVPGDYDTPELRAGFYQDWRPWESSLTLTGTWSYSGTPPRPRNEILSRLIYNTCCDGTFVLSVGPRWDGSFEDKEIGRLMEVGAWLKKNGQSIYKTRGGPWKYAQWGGSTRRGKTVYLHVLNWPGETLRIPAIPERHVISARLLDGTAVEVKQDAGAVAVRVPTAARDPLDTIIELTMDQPVDDVPAVEAGVVSEFLDTVTYGQVVSGQATVKTSSSSADWDPQGSPQALIANKPALPYAFCTSEEKNPWVEIDLGKEISVTGVRILNRGDMCQDRAATLRLSVSKDGETWQEIWKADGAAPVWEVPVTDFRAGAHLPGRKARYIRLETRPSTPTFFHLKQVEVWGKE